MNKYIYLIILKLYPVHTYTLQIPAVVTTPVTDALGSSISHTPNIDKFYHEELYAYGPQTPDIFRIHQLLFNEPVTIVKKHKKQYLISVKNSTFFDPLGKETSLMWVLSSSITPLNAIDTKNYYALPSKTDCPTCVLVRPIVDPETGIIYSAGTHCVIAHNPDSIYLYNHKTNTVKTVKIPSISYRINSPTESIENKRKLFVELAREWAAPHTSGYIPYVWGGSSYTQRVSGDFISTSSGYRWNSTYQEAVCGGCDCTGLVLRLAHTAGIPYTCKNSSAVAKLLKKITHYLDIQEGDIVWIPGHVMIISDLNKNTLIEARHYTQGYGRVHEIPVSDAFMDICTLQDLMDIQNSRGSVQRRHRNGSPLARVPVAFYSLVQ